MSDVELKMLLHAPTGHGKTHLLGTAVGDPRLSPALLADFEGGASTIRSKTVTVALDELESFVPPMDKITRVRLRKWADIDLIYAILEDRNCPYRSFFGDSLSEIHYLSLEGVIAEAVRKNPSSHDPDVAQQADYLKALGQMRKFIRYFRDLEGKHIVFTATSMDVEDARTRRGQVRPNLIGKLANEVPALLDWVGYLAIVEENVRGETKISRLLCTEPSERFVAKGRNDVDSDEQLPAMLKNPTLPEILDYLEGKRKA